MDVRFSDEQVALRGVVQAMITRHAPETRARELLDKPGSTDADLWSELTELGIAGLLIPHRFGGGDGTYIDFCVAMEELGRALAAAPVLGTLALAANAILQSADERAQATYLPRIAAGSTAAVAYMESDDWAVGEPATTAVLDVGRWTITGAKVHVLDGATADLVVVLAATEHGPSLFVAHNEADGFTSNRRPTIDGTRELADCTFRACPADLLGSAGDGVRVLTTVRQLAVIALAAEQLGGARAVLDSAVSYAKTRHQFGRPIGSFQAVKHRCADMLLQVERAAAAAHYAMWVATAHRADLARAAAMAGAQCSAAYLAVAEANIQISGAIGFTWEHAAHLHLRRARSSEILLGTALQHRAELAAIVGIAPGQGR